MPKKNTKKQRNLKNSLETVSMQKIIKKKQKSISEKNKGILQT